MNECNNLTEGGVQGEVTDLSNYENEWNLQGERQKVHKLLYFS